MSSQPQDASTSVVVLTYNGEKYLRQVLEMIQRQKAKAVEIIVIDSGSTDGTLEIVRLSAADLHQIPRSEFGHSTTRNLVARIARGKYIAFLTQDATPADSCWLDRLLAAFQYSPNVAGAFSRQVPRPGSDLLNANDLHMYFKEKGQVRTHPQDAARWKRDLWKCMQFSNASALYEKELLLQNPFDEELPVGEDQEWAKRMLEKGYRIVYQPESIVLHSHDHTLTEKYHRNLEMGAGFAKFLSPILGRRRFPLGAWLFHVGSDIAFLISFRAPMKDKLKWLLRSPLHRAAMHYAYYKGWNSALA